MCRAWIGLTNTWTYYTWFITAQRCFLVVLDYKSQLQGHMGTIFHFNYTEAGNFPLANCQHTAQGPSCTYWTLSITHYFLISLAWCKAALINSFMLTVYPINPYNLQGGPAKLQVQKQRRPSSFIIFVYRLQLHRKSCVHMPGTQLVSTVVHLVTKEFHISLKSRWELKGWTVLDEHAPYGQKH